MSSAAVDTERRNNIMSARQSFAAGQGAAETARAQTDSAERKQHAKAAFDNLHESLTYYAELIESGITFDTVGTSDIPENVTKALALAQEMCDIMKSGTAAAAAPADAPAAAPADAPAPKPAESESAAAVPNPASTTGTNQPAVKPFNISDMPSPPKTNIKKFYPKPEDRNLKRKFHELVIRKNEDRITGEPFEVFYTFMQQLLFFTLDNRLPINQTLADKLTGFQKEIELYNELKLPNLYDDAQKSMFSILKYIETNYKLLKRKDGTPITENDLVGIFTNIVSGGDTKVEQDLKLQKYGGWLKRGGKHRTIRRHRHKHRTTRRH